MLRRLAAALAVLGLLVPAVSHASVAAPDGYDRVAGTQIADGVEHLRLERHDPDVAINVARIDRDAPVALRTVSSYDRIAGGGPRLERTSSMCRRAHCLVAVNGDFFREEVPVGAVAADGELLRSPNPKHHQLYVDPRGRLQAGPLQWSGKLVATDLSQLRLDGVNTTRRRNDLVLYTSAFGASTGTNPYGAEMIVRFVKPRGGNPKAGQTSIVRVMDLRFGEGDLRIPRRGAVLSGHGKAARALRALWERIETREAGREALLRVETTPRVIAAIGGTPILLRDGKRWFADAPNDFVRGRHPRTLVGWNRRGDLWLVTADGRQPGYSTGFTLAEAAEFMRSLGATEAINLDGGGSSTFIVRGEVENRPSDRAISTADGLRIVPNIASGVRARNVERPVANALVVVPVGAVDLRAPGSPGLDIDVPGAETVSAPTPVATDPASNPHAALPAIVAALPGPPPHPGRALPVAGAAAVHLAVASWLGLVSRRRALGA